MRAFAPSGMHAKLEWSFSLSLYEQRPGQTDMWTEVAEAFAKQKWLVRATSYHRPVLVFAAGRESVRGGREYIIFARIDW